MHGQTLYTNAYDEQLPPDWSVRNDEPETQRDSPVWYICEMAMGKGIGAKFARMYLSCLNPSTRKVLNIGGSLSEVQMVRQMMEPMKYVRYL